MQLGYSKEKVVMDKTELLQYIEFLENHLKRIESNSCSGHYQKAFISSPAVWLIVDAKSGRVVDANFAAATFYGYTIEELKDMTIFQINIASVEEVKERMAGVQHNRYVESIPFQHRLKNGEIRNVEVYSGLLELNRQPMLSSIVIDVTAQKQAEQELKKSRDRLAMVIEATQVGIWEWDVVERQVYHDGHWRNVLGYDEEDSGCSLAEWQENCHPEDVPLVQRAAEEYLSGKCSRFDVEYRARHKDGTYHWARSTGKAIYNQENQPVQWIGSNTDITVHKQMELLQKERELILRDFAQIVADVGFIIDEAGQIIEVFGAEEKLLLIPKQDIQGKTIFDLFPSERANDLFEEIKRAFTIPGLRSFKHHIAFPEGDRTLNSRMGQMHYTVNNKRTVAVILQDITEQEKARRLLQVSYEMRRKSDLLNDLLSGIRAVDEDTVIYLKKLGLDLCLPLFCCVITFGSAEDTATRKAGIGVQQGLIDEVMEKLDGTPDIIAWGSRGAIGVLCQISESEQHSKRSTVQIAHSLKKQVCHWNPGLTVAIGIGEVQSGINGFKKSIRQAWEATFALRCGEKFVEGIAHYRDLGILQLLVDYGGRERATEFVADILGKLIAYDQEKRTDYVSTLEAILSSGNLRETANQLFLHPNTLLFRKRRIEKILGVSIGDFETKLALAAATKLYRINLSK